MYRSSPTCIAILLIAMLLVPPGLVSAAVVTRGAYLQMGNDRAVTVRWRTDTATNSRVRVGTDPASLNLVFDNATSTAEHEVRVTGLAAATPYYYSIGSTTQTLAGGDSSTYFQTAPVPGTRQPTRIWVIGDSGTANSSAAAVYNAYRSFTGSTHTDLWLMLGDNAYGDGTDAQYQSAVFNMYPQMLKQSVLWPTLGNHDGHTADSATQTGPYYNIFTLPRNAESGGIASGTEAYYSYDYGNIHFIVLDSYDTSRAVGSPMLTWLEADLQATNADWIIAFWHHPPYSKGSHDSDGDSIMTDMRENVLPILENHGVDLVLSGHSHSYERSKFIDGHYGLSSTFSDATHVKVTGSGRVDGTGAYAKPSGGAAHEGAVYAVAGSSGQIGGGTLDHPAMFISLNELGSMVLDVDGLTLNSKFVNSNGTTRDYFTITKGAGSGSTVSGLAWNDSDRDGVRESGEAMLQNVGVRLYTPANALVSTRFTGSNGAYSFTGVTPGNYYVQFVPGGLTLSPQNQGGNDALDSDANSTSGKTAVFGLTSGTSVGNVDAGLYLSTTTVRFQDGLNAYAGTQDTFVASAASGANYGSAISLLAYGDDGTRGRLVTLLKWNVSAIPAGRTVVAASIALWVYKPSSGTYNLRAMNASWSEGGATWANTDPSTKQGITVGSFVPSVSGNYAVQLNNAGVSLVQGWINGLANNGILVIDADTADRMNMLSSEYGTQSVRPRLTVIYH